jgi:hypothetical protein
MIEINSGAFLTINDCLSLRTLNIYRDSSVNVSIQNTPLKINKHKRLITSHKDIHRSHISMKDIKFMKCSHHFGFNCTIDVSSRNSLPYILAMISDDRTSINSSMKPQTIALKFAEKLPCLMATVEIPGYMQPHFTEPQ